MKHPANHQKLKWLDFWQKLSRRSHWYHLIRRSQRWDDPMTFLQRQKLVGAGRQDLSYDLQATGGGGSTKMTSRRRQRQHAQANSSLREKCDLNGLLYTRGQKANHINQVPAEFQSDDSKDCRIERNAFLLLLLFLTLFWKLRPLSRLPSSREYI